MAYHFWRIQIMRFYHVLNRFGRNLPIWCTTFANRSFLKKTARLIYYVSPQSFLRKSVRLIWYVVFYSTGGGWNLVETWWGGFLSGWLKTGDFFGVSPLVLWLKAKKLTLPPRERPYHFLTEFRLFDFTMLRPWIIFSEIGPSGLPSHRPQSFLKKESHLAYYALALGRF